SVVSQFADPSRARNESSTTVSGCGRKPLTAAEAASVRGSDGRLGSRLLEQVEEAVLVLLEDAEAVERVFQLERLRPVAHRLGEQALDLFAVRRADPVFLRGFRGGFLVRGGLR